MKERPILFSAPMVRALLDGRKTQTRRVIKPQPPNYIDELHGNEFSKRAPYKCYDSETNHEIGFGFQDDDDTFYRCPYGTAGDRLWVREAFHKIPGNTGACVYRASCENGSERNYKFKPSIHMPRWASRITLEITGVRVERVQDISDHDAFAEGVANQRQRESTWYEGKASGMFKELWQSINGPDSWALNPWVWCVEFKNVEPITKGKNDE